MPKSASMEIHKQTRGPAHAFALLLANPRDQLLHLRFRPGVVGFLQNSLLLLLGHHRVNIDSVLVLRQGH